MPPKIKTTKEDIINVALELVRTSGKDSLNARSIAALLDCSTQPVFSNFSSMKELVRDTAIAAYKVYLDFIEREIKEKKYPEYKAMGIAYIRFANEEKELFKFLFMRDRTKENTSNTPSDFDKSIELIMKANNLSREDAQLMHLEIWSCVHGIATMAATSFLSFSEEIVSTMLSDVYQGIRKHKSEGKNERN